MMEVEDTSIKDNTVNKSDEKGWMQKLGELVIWGYIREHIEQHYKHKLYIPVAIKGELLKFLGIQFIHSKILLTNKQKDLLFEILSKQIIHSNILTGLKLLYRASEHAFNAQKFHNLCDNKTHSITVIQSDHNHIFGGYLSVGFNSNNKFVEDNKAFLFSISNNNSKIFNIDEYEVEYAAKNLATSGPAFGGGFDLYICDKCNIVKDSYCKSNAGSYNIDNGSQFCGSSDNWESNIKFKFFVKDYEVFQLLS
eukprot:92746_1